MTIRCDLFSLMKNLSLALDFNREGINDHHRKVAFVAYILGEQIGLSLSEKSNLLYMGLIHDIGVSSWSEKDALSKFNFEELQDHCIRGYDFLQNSYFENFAPIILSHHDYYRGGNFTKLKGEEIPFLSRILFVADRVAITFNPNVNPIEQSGKIIEKITLNKWTLFDPLVVEKFVEVAKREEFWLILGTDEILNMSLNEFPKEQKDLGINEIKSLARLFAKLIDQKSRFTFYHSQMVAAVAAFVAELLGYSFDNFEMIEVAGLLHDLGKLSVPLEILEKPGKLMSEEFIYIRQHTFFTYYLLKNVFPENVARIAAFHHEKLDGSGYPFKKKDEELGEEEQMMAVVDMFVALSEDRPYRKGLGFEDVAKILKEEVKKGKIAQLYVELLLDNYIKVIEIMKGVQV